MRAMRHATGAVPARGSPRHDAVDSAAAGASRAHPAPSARFGPLLELVAQRFRAESAVLLVPASDRGQLQAVSWSGLTPEQAVAVLPFIQSDAEIRSLDRPWVVQDVMRDRSGRSGFTLLAVESAGFRGFAAIPLCNVGGTSAGVIVVLGTARLRNDPHAVRHSVIIGTHAAELARCHEELRAQRVGSAELRALVDSLPEAIVRFNAAGTIEAASPSTTSVLGHAPDSLVGRPFHELVYPGDRSRVLGPVADHAARGGTRRLGRPCGVRVIRKDGRTIHAELAVFEIEPRARFVGIIRDIDDRLSTEARLRQSDRLTALGTLAAGLGHDMNNMLLPIRAHLNAIDAATADSAPRLVEHVVEIRNGVRYLQQLADGLHYLTNDSGPQRDVDGGTDLARWWASVGSLLSRSLPPLTAVKSVIRPDLPRVQVSEQALTQAVLNLFVNAGEAITAAGRPAGGRVTIRARASDDGRSVVLSVEDDGAGMAEDVRQRAFDMFFTTKTRGLGSGLGLALVHRVVNEAGGSAAIESTPGVGTVMRLALPVVELVPEGAGCRVAVTLADGRAGAFAASALEARGFAAEPGDDPGTDTDAWVVDPRVVRPADARRWATARAGRVIVLFGRLTPASRAQWRGLASAMIEHAHDFDALLVGVDRASAVILRELKEKVHGKRERDDRRGKPGAAGARQEEGHQPDHGDGGGGGPTDVRG